MPITLPEVLELDRRDVAIGHTHNNRARQSLARIEGFGGFGRIAATVPRNGAARRPVVLVYAVSIGQRSTHMASRKTDGWDGF